MLLLPGVASAETSQSSKSQGLVVVEATEDAIAAGPIASPLSADCGGLFDPCGILNNRTGRSLEVARIGASTSHTGCSIPSSSPRGTVAPGRNSNQNPPGFKDTDCFRSNECSVFYLGWHNPGEWIRIWTSVFVYDLGC